jgi:hypothetical protein
MHGRKTMIRKLAIGMWVFVAAGAAYSQTTRPEKTLQEQADELQGKIEGLQSMTEVLTLHRGKAKKRAEMMTAYLTSTGKLQEYEDSNVSPPAEKTQMTFDHALELAVEHAQQQGATHVHAVDADELDFLARQVDACTKLAKKAWDELMAVRNQTRSMGAYLDSIGKAEAYRKWAAVEADKQAQAHQEKLDKDHQEQVAAYKEKQAQQEKERQKIADQMRQDRLAQLQRQFQLHQEQLYNQMRENTAAPGYGWDDWNDPYRDVYYPSAYRR